jgi:broad specificity phosphatase PhoE
MTSALPQVYLVRHGQTAWSLSGQHTGRSDIPLTPTGEDEARQVAQRLAGQTFSRVFTSPSQRARRTCELAGYALVAQVDEDLAEWSYGKYEGLTSAEILHEHPDWDVFDDGGGPGGETVADVTARADRVVSRLRSSGEKVLVFSSGHFLRSLAARWLGMDVTSGRHLLLNTASLSILGYEHSLNDPAIALWNERPISKYKMEPRMNTNLHE